MKKDTYRVVTRGTNGQLRVKDYGSKDSLLQLHTQVGIDDCSTDQNTGMPKENGGIDRA